jgi:transglutaminase superfamily protein/transglutaminase TgpA-like protein
VRRTALLYVLPAAVVAANWLRLESPRGSGGQALWIVLLALCPALAPTRLTRVGAVLGALLLAARSAFGVSLFDARPFDGRHDFFGPVLGRFRDGFLDFYDVELPIDPSAHPLMHGVILVAIFGFCLAVGLAIAARRPVAAVLALVVGAGWPATLLVGDGGLLRGAVVLAAALVLFAGLAARDVGTLGRALAAGAGVVVCAIVTSSSPAVAKPELLNWQRWDFYNQPQTPVTVSYVWRSDYSGIHFPKKVTTVLRIKASPISLYWRATTLDEFNGRGWVERLPGAARPHPSPIPPRDPLLPPEARANKHVLKEQVTVAALRDRHLVGASLPIGFTFDDSLGAVRFARSGVAVASENLARDQSYTAWSYAPRPSAAELAAATGPYPARLTYDGYFDVEPGVTLPPFGVPDRDSRVRLLFKTYSFDRLLEPYEPVYELARKVVGHPGSPYAAAIGLETWFRRTGGFRYDERPGRVGDTPLAEFVLRTQRGYCQHFAGAMALMLRYLGIPARVAAGFTSGSYDGDRGTWTVTDHDAHTWVEAWFPGYGWLPFDPTPGRGSLSAGYTVSSPRFDFTTARRLLELAAAVVVPDPHDFKQDTDFGQKGAATPSAEGAGAIRRAGPLARGGGTTTSHGSLLRLLALVAAGVAAAIVAAKLALRRARYLTRDPRRSAAACRRELADFLADQGVGMPASATAAEVAAAIDEELDVDARRFAEAVDAARFGPAQGARASARRARVELRRLERQLRERLTRVERIRGLLSLRSLGFSS